MIYPKPERVNLATVPDDRREVLARVRALWELFGFAQTP